MKGSSSCQSVVVGSLGLSERTAVGSEAGFLLAMLNGGNRSTDAIIGNASGLDADLVLERLGNAKSKLTTSCPGAAIGR